MIGCKGEDETLCVKSSYCVAKDVSPKDVALACYTEAIKSPKWGSTLCALSLYALEVQLKVPETLMRSEHACLCAKDACALPLKAPVDKPVCAVCCLRILPTPVGLFAPPTGGKGWPSRPIGEIMKR